MIHELLKAQQERLRTVEGLMALRLHRHGLSYREIAKRLDVDPRKAKRMVERGQALFPDATVEELASQLQTRSRKLGQSAHLLAQMVMRRPPGQAAGNN